jgi:hypothetical protein
MATPESAKPGGVNFAEPIVVPQAAVEAGAARVFVTSPRLFSFSHRHLASLRHPFFPVALLQVDADIAKAKKQWQSRSERLADVFTPSSANMNFEEERWKHVGFMLDTVMFEAQISARRANVLESHGVRNALETVWNRIGAGGNGVQGVTYQAYTDLHLALYEHVLGAPLDSVLHQLLMQVIETDWTFERDPETERVPYGKFFISLIEIADNWIASCEADAYACFLKDVVVPCASTTKFAVNTGVPHANAEDDWEEVVECLRGKAQGLNFPVIRAEQTAVHSTVYKKSNRR